jgi:hypothetical protein
MKCKKENPSFDNIYSGSLCEKIHLKFCKFILGVHKRTTNIAVLSELGRFPLYFNIIKGMLLYCYRLENLGREFPLLAEALLHTVVILNNIDSLSSSYFEHSNTKCNSSSITFEEHLVHILLCRGTP